LSDKRGFPHPAGRKMRFARLFCFQIDPEAVYNVSIANSIFSGNLIAISCQYEFAIRNGNPGIFLFSGRTHPGFHLFFSLPDGATGSAIVTRKSGAMDSIHHAKLR